MMLDDYNNLKFSVAMPPVAAVTDDTPFVSGILDTADYNTALFAGVFGTNADVNATYAALLEYGDTPTLTDAAAVPDEYLLGVEAMGLDFADDNKTFKLGYIGPKRYIRMTITPGGNTGNAFIAAMWVQGHGRKKPASDQVV